MKQHEASRHQGIKASRHSDPSPSTLAPSHPPLRAFTLTELMVAIAVLIVVIIATSKIFGTAARVTGTGQALATVMTEAAAIEQKLRSDIAKLSREGFFAIRNVAVPNNVNGPGAPLLNPALPPFAVIRCDQLLFFANGVESSQVARQTQGSNHRGQGAVSRVYYGHGFQLVNGFAYVPQVANRGRAHDPSFIAPQFMCPWFWQTNPAVTMVRTEFATGNGASNATSIFQPFAAANEPINGNQPPATQWTLCRQPIALVDDDTAANNDNSKTVYLAEVVSARSIWIDHAGYGFTREIRNGRVDCAALLPNEIRNFVTLLNPATGVPRPWIATPPIIDQRTIIRNAVYYPRAERKAPSAYRVDQALTNHVISSACSSFIVDWTYDYGTGAAQAYDAFNGVMIDYPGMQVRSDLEQPWFGMRPNDFDNNGVPDDDRGVYPLVFPMHAGLQPAGTTLNPCPRTIFADTNANNIESTSPPLPAPYPGVTTYEAFFGYNQDCPFFDETDPPPGTLVLGRPARRGYIADDGGPCDTTDPLNVLPKPSAAYTPWPTAIRITMTLHDPDGKLEGGREFQFVIDLPRRDP